METEFLVRSTFRGSFDFEQKSSFFTPIANTNLSRTRFETKKAVLFRTFSLVKHLLFFGRLHKKIIRFFLLQSSSNFKEAYFDARRAENVKLYADITSIFCDVWRKIRPLKRIRFRFVLAMRTRVRRGVKTGIEKELLIHGEIRRISTLKI